MGLMHVLGLQFDPANVRALPLIIGFAAEYGVDIVLRSLEAPEPGGGSRLWTLGLLLVIGATATLLASLVTLPTLVRLAHAHARRPVDRESPAAVSVATSPSAR